MSAFSQYLLRRSDTSKCLEKKADRDCSWLDGILIICDTLDQFPIRLIAKKTRLGAGNNARPQGQRHLLCLLSRPISLDPLSCDLAAIRPGNRHASRSVYRPCRPSSRLLPRSLSPITIPCLSSKCSSEVDCYPIHASHSFRNEQLGQVIGDGAG
ncbi:MAG: hypothetical protein JWP89_403 [Schlesneria sp.]|nr:hypothetical protein [Schlesneria sp.]